MNFQEFRTYIFDTPKDIWWWYFSFPQKINNRYNSFLLYILYIGLVVVSR